MNIKYIILLCLINYIATVQSADVGEIQMETMDRPDSSAYSLDDVIYWSKKLELVKIRRCGKLLTDAIESFPQRVKNILLQKNWPAPLVDDLVAKYNESNWPSWITAPKLQNEETQELMKNLKCRLIPGVLSDNQEQAVIVFASDNTHMPSDMTARPGFLMNFNGGALYFIDFEEFLSVPKLLTLVEEIKWDLLLTVPPNSLKDRVKRILTKRNFSSRLVDPIVEKYNRDSWPSGIRGTQLQNDDKKSLLEEYKCRRIPGFISSNREEAVIVFASENKHMPPDMIAEPGFLFIFQQGALPINNCCEKYVLSNFNCPRCPIAEGRKSIWVWGYLTEEEEEVICTLRIGKHQVEGEVLKVKAV
ncbi:uncharacterized protein LOC126836941 [Adelges cooleyi]|uniref:uncharacterized protein LOC126836941 n=1 Tax=Adelges cooleyi TaxID=133065 RepID=UPI0021809284|nr:uncharacterized protein LOC126836941 [Adelges cooleyi]